VNLLQALAARADRLGADWFTVKTALEHAIGFADDALHVLVGVVLQLLAAMVLRVPIARWRPWLVVLALELLNEWNDLRIDLWPHADRSAQLGEGLKDILLTMALPTLLLLATRWLPGLFRHP